MLRESLARGECIGLYASVRERLIDGGGGGVSSLSSSRSSYESFVSRRLSLNAWQQPGTEVVCLLCHLFS